MKLPKMKVPKVKDIKSKLSAAKLLGVVVKNSIQFKLRRSAMKRFSLRDFDTVIVDMDGTTYRTDANLEGLKVMFPETDSKGVIKGEKIYDSLISEIAQGKYSIEKATVEGLTKYLIKRKTERKDFPKILEKVKPTIRVPLIQALKKIKKRGKKIVLATLSSQYFGEILNQYLDEEFGFSFDYVVGTELDYDSAGKIIGVKSIVGTKDSEYEKIPVKTKLTAIRDSFQNKNEEFDVKRAVLITDCYSDIDLAKMLVTILITPDNPTTAQQVSRRLKLADYILHDNKLLQKKLEEIILYEENEGKETSIKN